MEEIGKENDLVGADLCGEPRSGEAKAAAGELQDREDMGRGVGVEWGKKRNCQFPLPRP